VKNNGNNVYLSERLIKKMNQCFNCGLSVVRAPSGFGKSVCTDEYFRRYVGAISKIYWITCDGLTPGEISNRFIANINEVDPVAGDKLKQLSALTSSTAMQVSEIVKSVECELPTWMVFDRIEALPEDYRACCAGLREPDDKKFHIILITKDKIDIKAPTITAEDLTLTQSELADMAKLDGVVLKVKDAEILHRFTSGWLTAASLAIENIKQTGHMIDTSDVDSLIGVLYDALPRERRKDIRRLSYFSRLTPAKIQFLLEEREIGDDVRAFFRDFPLIRYSTREECWYLHEKLSNYIIANSSDVIALARSAAWYSQTGAPEKAISCYYSRLDYEGVLSVDFSRVNPEEIICGKPFIQIVRELARCPFELKLKYPISMLRVAHFLFGDGDFSTYDSLMNEMEAIIRETGDSRNYGEWLLESIYQVYPNLDAMRERVEMAAGYINGRSRCVDSYGPFMFGNTSMVYCFHSNLGDSDSEADKMERFISVYSDLTGGHGRGAEKLFRGELMCLRGRLDEAEILACQAESIARVNNQYCIAVSAVLLQGVIASCRLDTEKMKMYAEKMYSLKKDFAYASDSFSKRHLRIASGILLTIIGGSVPAGERIDIAGIGPSSMMPKTVDAIQLVTTEKYQELIGEFEAYLTLDARSCTLLYKHFVYIGLSVCYFRLGNVQKAMSYLQEALDVSVADGYFMAFAKLGSVLDKILTLVAPAYTDAVAKIAEIRSKCMPEEVSVEKEIEENNVDDKLRNLPEPLTEREIEIARLAAQGMRNKEIAAALFLSERTVSNRLYIIFQKLDIDRRSELIELMK